MRRTISALPPPFGRFCGFCREKVFFFFFFKTLFVKRILDIIRHDNVAIEATYCFKLHVNCCTYKPAFTWV